MSRLDSFIRRISAQRDILNDLAPRLDDVPGMVFDFGLGSGRTFDHLRELLPARRIIVFESVERIVEESFFSTADIAVGDIRETAARFQDGCAALIHADIGTGREEVDAALMHWLPGLVARLLVTGGYAASSTALTHPELVAVPLPPDVGEGRYFAVRRL